MKIFSTLFRSRTQPVRRNASATKFSTISPHKQIMSPVDGISEPSIPRPEPVRRNAASKSLDTSCPQPVRRNAATKFFSTKPSNSDNRLYKQNLLVGSFGEAVGRNAGKRFLTTAIADSPRKTAQGDRLYRRLSRVGSDDNSVVPVLEQWVNEGNQVDKHELQRMITELKYYGRYKHALEISLWMTDRRYLPLSANDVANRMYLIYRIDGLQKVEKYYDDVSQVLKMYQVHLALLNCYVHEKSVEKAESLVQKLWGTGFAITTLTYNCLMNLYHKVGDCEKIEALMLDMEKEGVSKDSYTYSICFSAYANAFNGEGIDIIVKEMEADPRFSVGCKTYHIAANAYFKVGQVEKVIEMVKKMERSASKSKRKTESLIDLLRMYGRLGKKDDVYRIWKCIKNEKIFNRGYMATIESLLMVDDIEGAEEIFEEWESRDLSYDFRIPDFLIKAYVQNDELEKAEILLNRGIEKGGTPTHKTRFYLAFGYVKDNQVSKAAEVLKQAAPRRPEQKAIKDRILSYLQNLEKQEDAAIKEEILREMEGIISKTAVTRLHVDVMGENSDC